MPHILRSERDLLPLKPQTKDEWSMMLTFIEWFLWLVREHTPAQITKALRAATETLK